MRRYRHNQPEFLGLTEIIENMSKGDILYFMDSTIRIYQSLLRDNNQFESSTKIPDDFFVTIDKNSFRTVYEAKSREDSSKSNFFVRYVFGTFNVDKIKVFDTSIGFDGYDKDKLIFTRIQFNLGEVYF